MNKANGTGSIDRSARVRRIKRVLIGLIIAVILLPTVLCIILFMKLNRIERELKELSLRKETVTIVQGDTFITKPKASKPEEDTLSATKLIKTDSEESIVSEEVIISEEDVDSKEVNTLKTEEETEELAETKAADVPESIQNYVGSKITRKVYLTFDDGPSNNTEAILDILDRYGVKATFFVNGKEDESLKPLYKEIVKRGHVIGMHSYTHKYGEIYANEDAFIYDLNKIQAYIYEQCGVMTDIYRFPGGSSNTVSRVPVSKFADILSARGITYYDWNVVAGDASSTYGLPANVLTANVIRGVLANEDSVVLMHDLPEKDTTVEALSEIIEQLQNMGCDIVPIDGETPDMHQDFARK